MLFSFNTTYNKNQKNSFRVLLDDNNKTLVVILDIYAIKEQWYLDISTDNEKLHIGQRINTYEDLFEICKRRYKYFPDVKLVALPVNINGFDVEFNTETAGILQDLMVVKNE